MDNHYIEKVIEKHLNMLLQIAYHNLKYTSDADDIVQEVFIKLLSCSDFKDEVYLKSWLIRVTINLCKDYNKSAWRKKTEQLIEITEIIEPIQEVSHEILEEVRKLPVKYRNIIYLYYFQEYTVPEISKIFEKNINTVQSQLNRARKKLKTILLEGGYENV